MPVLRKNNSLSLETRIVLRDFTEISVDERGPVAGASGKSLRCRSSEDCIINTSGSNFC